MACSGVSGIGSSVVQAVLQIFGLRLLPCYPVQIAQTSSEMGYNKWACSTCVYEIPIVKQAMSYSCSVQPYDHPTPLIQMTSRTRMSEKKSTMPSEEMRCGSMPSWVGGHHQLGEDSFYLLSAPCNYATMRHTSINSKSDRLRNPVKTSPGVWMPRILSPFGFALTLILTLYLVLTTTEEWQDCGGGLIVGCM